MSSIVSVSAVTALHGAAASIGNRGASVSPVRAPRVGDNASQAQVPAAPQVKTSPAAAAQNLPLDVLMSTSRPTAKSGPVVNDYEDLQGALRSGNLQAAQQAYLRLQHDLLLASPSEGTASTGTAGSSVSLDAVA